MNGMLAITGITGKSGLVLAEMLADNYLQAGEKFPNGIRALVRNSSNTEKIDNLLPDIEMFRGSLDDLDYLKYALANVDTLIHIAGIHFSKAIVNAAAQNNVRRLVFVHTTGIYSKYKSAGEEYRNIEKYVYEVCRENNIVLTILRPTMIYGCVSDHNVITFIKMVDRFPLVPVVNGARYELQPVCYKDLGRAYFAVLMNEVQTANKNYNLSGAEPILLRKMLMEIGNQLNKHVRFFSVPYPIAYAGAWIVFLLTFKRKDYREKVQRLCENRTFSHEEAVNDFGYCSMSFEEGIGCEVKEFLSKKS